MCVVERLGQLGTEPAEGVYLESPFASLVERIVLQIGRWSVKISSIVIALMAQGAYGWMDAMWCCLVRDVFILQKKPYLNSLFDCVKCFGLD